MLGTGKGPWMSVSDSGDVWKGAGSWVAST